jgi:hypothetical protein
MTLESLVDRLQSNCGDMLDACRRTGVSLIFVEQWRKDDAKVNERLLEAERVGTQGLVSAAIQRAVAGVDEDVYYRGEVVGVKTNYSDGLLQTLLKAKVPEFAKDSDGAGAHVTVNVANIMPRAENYEQWLAMQSATTKALAKPDPKLEIPEAQYEEVPRPFAGISL